MPAVTKYQTWVLTRNNYSSSWEGDLTKLFEKGQILYACVGRERGEQGTPHLQGWLYLKVRKTLKTLKNMFKDTALDGAHWEPMRGGVKSNELYCGKEDKAPFRIGVCPKGQGSRSDVQGLLEAVRAGKTEGELAVEFPTAHARFHKYAARMREVFRAEEAKKELEKEMKEVKLHPWQQKVLERLETQPRRQVTWVWEEEGGVGKSFFARWLHMTKGAFICTGGKHADIIHAFVVSGTPKWFILDLSRDQEERVPYTVLEHLKNGVITSTKYYSETVYFTPCKILCLSNYEPDKDKFSKGRWDIHHVNGLK